MKKFLSLLLALVMVFSLAACGGGETNESNAGNPENSNSGNDETQTYTGPDWDAINAMSYDDACDALYDWNLGKFYEYYKVAKAELDDLDKRMALMAIAEAKLMEAAVNAPIYGDGGSYAMYRAIPRTITSNSWGLDEYRLETYMVTNELVKAADRRALVALWADSETANDYLDAAKAYLTENGYTLNDTYYANTSYIIRTWDILVSSYSSTSQFLAETFSPLLQYDNKNVQQPALATGYEVSDDGLTYTFHIREGVQWVDQQGRPIGQEVTAEDWVTSMMHVADNNSALGYLMTTTDGCGIKNYDNYITGQCSFEDVGVKAIDKYTLEYTLEAPFPAFLSMLGYGCFAPLNRAYYESMGGKFGTEFDAGAADYLYGKGPDSIAYCGPFLVNNYTEGNTLSFIPNPAYWNKDIVTLKGLVYYILLSNDDPLRNYNDCLAGTVANTALNSYSLPLAKEAIPEGETESYFDLYTITTTNSATCYVGWYNVNRGIWHNYNDESAVVSPQTEADHDRTRQAMNNHNFRLALAYAFDRGAYNAASVGEDLKYASLKNSYVPGTFGQLSKDVTVDINGTATTFKAGTYFGEIEQAQITADGYPIQVWDPNGDDGIGSGDGFDGWYNPTEAVKAMEKAVAELAQVGVEISAENPIYIDLPVMTFNPTNANMGNTYKQSIETVLGGKVIVNIVDEADVDQSNDATYYFEIGSEANFDISLYSGWGPDYNDAQTYLDTLQPYGYMCKNIGLY